MELLVILLKLLATGSSDSSTDPIIDLPGLPL